VQDNLTSVSHIGYNVASPTLPPAINPSLSSVYDSLGRLTTAVKAESGSTTYLYDNNSNLKRRTDGQLRSMELSYDLLDRVGGKTYRDSTPAVTYGYAGNEDFQVSVSSSASNYTYSNHDALGRPGAGTQLTAGQSYVFPSVVWTPQGEVRSVTYSTGRVVTTSFDMAGRISGVTGLMNGVSTPDASNVTYAAHGRVSLVTLGDNITRSAGYNRRLQMTTLTAGSHLVEAFFDQVRPILARWGPELCAAVGEMAAWQCRIPYADSHLGRSSQAQNR